jgi:hypothetical protein
MKLLNLTVCFVGSGTWRSAANQVLASVSGGDWKACTPFTISGSLWGVVETLCSLDVSSDRFGVHRGRKVIDQ